MAYRYLIVWQSQLAVLTAKGREADQLVCQPTCQLKHAELKIDLTIIELVMSTAYIDPVSPAGLSAVALVIWLTKTKLLSQLPFSRPPHLISPLNCYLL